MKNFCMVLLILVAMTVFVVSGCAQPAPAPTPGPAPTPAPATEVFTWRVQHMLTPAFDYYAISFPRLIDRVNKNTNGRVIIKPFPSGALVPTAETFANVALGTIDGGILTGSLSAMGRMPVAGVEDTLPYGFSTNEQCQAFMWGDWQWKKPYEEFIREQYAKQGVYYVTSCASDNMWVITKKPIYTTDDLKGYKIRTWGLYGRLLEKLGATPVMAPLPETYTGVATGVFDGVNTGTAGFLGIKLYEVCKYMMSPPIGKSSHHLEINLKAWQKLPPDLQTIVQLTAREWSEWETRNFAEFPPNVEELKAKGVQYIDIKDVDKVRKAAQEIWDEVGAKDPVAAEGVARFKEFCRVKGLIK